MAAPSTHFVHSHFSDSAVFAKKVFEPVDISIAAYFDDAVKHVQRRVTNGQAHLLEKFMPVTPPWNADASTRRNAERATTIAVIDGLLAGELDSLGSEEQKIFRHARNVLSNRNGSAYAYRPEQVADAINARPLFLSANY